MLRATMQVLVLPFVLRDDGSVEYGVLLREDSDTWQGVAGGAEDDEMPREAAARETAEELGTDAFELTALDSLSTVPAAVFPAWSAWREKDPDLFVIPEHCFGARVHDPDDVRLSAEHREIAWVPFNVAHSRLRWDSNRNALWELDQRLLNDKLR